MNHYFEKFSRENFPEKNSPHFGNSMAIIIGDTLAALGNKTILRSGFSEKLIIKTALRLQEIIALTVIGQVKDVHMEHLGNSSEKEILKMYEYKTARYTMEGPLHLGMILGGGKKRELETISVYATSIGIAFQIQDDILGIFGTEEKLGKSISSDIEKGKQTILLARALSSGNIRQKKELRAILKKKRILQGDREKFRKIIVETGSLEYTKKLADNYIKKGKESLDKAKISQKTKEFLLNLADFITSRSN
jgi:geranylgeranyl diphosphate synthase type I